ncbi:MAG: trypsin-like peptidase domain-containing protein [Planctomycetaceae bacterium]|nr:trypsin-like peptidase domain-containing protein [Planctomycetaceae bacterium]
MYRASRSLALRCALLLCAVIAAPFLNAFAQEAIPQETLGRVTAATVMVYIEYEEPLADNVSWGTGYIVGDGLVMTNAHVVSERVPKRIMIRNDYIPPTEATVLASRYDTNEFLTGEAVQYIASTLIADANINVVSLSKKFTNFDVALLKVQLPPGLPVLRFTKDARANEPVYAIGFPGSGEPVISHDGRNAIPGAPLRVTAGRVNKVINRDPQLVMHDALAKSGNSGGPIVNARGEVVAMQTWSTDPDYRGVVTSFGLASRDLTAFAELNGGSVAVGGQGIPLSEKRAPGSDAREFVLHYANEGDVNFLALAGLLHYMGDCGFTRDPQLAVNYLVQAIQRGGNSPNVHLFQAGLAAVLIETPGLNAPYQPKELLMAANHSSSISQNSQLPDYRLLAYEAAQYMQGAANGFGYDPARSSMLANKALEGAFSLPLALTGYHYYFGDTGHRDHDTAMFNAREAARSGVPEGLSLLAHMYYDSSVVPHTARSRAVAKALAQEAAGKNDTWGMGLLANIYYESGDPAEAAQARELARTAAARGNRMGLYAIGRMAWDEYLANPGDATLAAKAWTFIDMAERQGVSVALRGGAGGGQVLRSSREVLAYFPPDVQQWLMSEGRREQGFLTSR